MREYYYLTGLEDSPYDLTMADALYLGATAKLHLYALIEHEIVMDYAITKERVRDSYVYLGIRPEIAAAAEKAYVNGIPYEASLSTAQIGEMYNGFSMQHPFSTSATDFLVFVRDVYPSSKSTATHDPITYPVVRSTDFICFTEDLEELEKDGTIQAKDMNGNSSDRQEYPPQLEALTIAWRKFWKNADPTDRTACPKKPDVVAWLIAQGFSAKNADAGATIIKPQWAIDKGW